MSSYKLNVQPRKLFGRKIKSLRKTGIIPGNVFGQKVVSTAVQFDAKVFHKLYQEAGETGLINLTIEGETKTRPVLISGFHSDPVSGDLLHVDFHQVDLKQKVVVTIPLRFVGEAPASKEGLIVATLKNEVEVEALPTDLPESIEVDLSPMTKLGDNILASDLKVDKTKLKLQIDEAETIVSVQEQAKIEESTPTEATEAEPTSTDGETKPAEETIVESVKSE